MYNLVDGAVGRLAVGSVMGSNPRAPGNYHRLNADGSRSNDLLEKNMRVHPQVCSSPAGGQDWTSSERQGRLCSKLQRPWGTGKPHMRASTIGIPLYGRTHRLT